MESEQDPSDAVAAMFAALLARTADHQASLEQMYVSLRDNGWLPRVRTHRYRCPRSCGVIAVAFPVGDRTVLAVRDYKYSQGLNQAVSVPTARAKNTLDGDRHWPAHVYDMTELADWGESAGAHVVCRHVRTVLSGARVLSDTSGVVPGHDGKPTRLANDAGASVPRS